jgi:MFS family permease
VNSSASDVRVATWRAIPGSIWALGFVSMFMDISSEMIHSLLPVFLVSVLGAGPLAVGIIEGVAEATASVTKIFSGVLSDYLGKRKLLVSIGYGLAAVTKPLFPLAPSMGWVLTARFVDRIGKGIRGAPRDALVGDLAPPALRGACYGLRQSLDTVGAFAGPTLAAILMAATADNFRVVFWVAAVPAFVAVTLLLVGVREPAAAHKTRDARAPLHTSELRQLGGSYWWLVIVASVLTLARFSEAFLLLRAQSVGLAVALVPLVLIVMNVAYALSAYPAGYLSDRMDRRRLVALGALVLIASDIVLARATGIAHALLGAVLWGLHMGLTQGLLAALVNDTAPARLRGTAFGIFNLAGGAAMLVASVLAGWLWARYGAAATFYAGALFTLVAFGGLLSSPLGADRAQRGH